MGSYPHWTCRTLDQRLPHPHYSDPTWDKPQTVFGSYPIKTDEGAYDDRMLQWDYKKHREAWDTVQTEDKRTPRAIQEYISNYYGREVELAVIIYQTRPDNGHNVAYYGWNWKTDETEVG